MVRRPKQTPVSDKYAQLIVTYFEHMKKTYPKVKYLFPIRQRNVWLPLFAEQPKSAERTANAEHRQRAGPANMAASLPEAEGLRGCQKIRSYFRLCFPVKDTLDLERTETALRYIEEFVPKLETGETGFTEFKTHFLTMLKHGKKPQILSSQTPIICIKKSPCTTSMSKRARHLFQHLISGTRQLANRSKLRLQPPPLEFVGPLFVFEK